jgi:hypothetical protein
MVQENIFPRKITLYSMGYYLLLLSEQIAIMNKKKKNLKYCSNRSRGKVRKHNLLLTTPSHLSLLQRNDLTLRDDKGFIAPLKKGLPFPRGVYLKLVCYSCPNK